MSEARAAPAPSSHARGALGACLLALLLGASGERAWAQEGRCLTRIDPALELPQQVAQGLLLEGACSRDVPFMFWLGRGLNTLQHYDLAVDRLERVLMLDPDHLTAQIEYAIALEGSGERSAADALLAQVEVDRRLSIAQREVIVARRRAWAFALPAGYAHRQTLSLLTGYDNNLLGSTRTTQLELTLPDGSLPVILDPASRPRSGIFGRLDWRLDARLPTGQGEGWTLAAALSLRHTPAHSDTDFSQFGLVLERNGSGPWAPYGALTLQTLGVQGRRVYQLIGAAGGVDHELALPACRVRLGAEYQYRSYPDAQAFNGHYAGGLLQLLCGEGWLFRLRAGQDSPEYAIRPGGRQSRASVLAVRQMLLGPHRLNLEVDAEHQQDARGFSPLLENNQQRRVNKMAYRIEYTHLGGRIEPFVGAEWLRQQSNLALYAVDTRIVYAGLRVAW